MAATKTTFTDAKGRAWDLNPSVGDLKRVREATGVDLFALAKDPEKFVQVMFLDAHALAPVAWAIVSPKAAGLGFAVTEDDFLDALDGPALDAAVVALWEGFGDFFRRTPIGHKIRTDGAVAAMAAIEAALLAAGDDPTQAGPGPAEADPVPAASVT